MRHVLPLAAVAAFVLNPTAHADDAADARAIVEKAIRARGDKPGAALAVTMWKEKIKFEGVGQDINLDAEWTFQSPDKLRLQITLAIGGNTLDLVGVVNGEKMWYLVNGQLQDGQGPQLAEALGELNRMWATSLTPLLTDDAFKLTPAKEKVVNGKPAVGVAVRNGKRPVVTLYFDQETGLLVKREATVKDPNADGREVLEEVVLSDYKQAGGRKYHTKMVVSRDGKTWYRSEVSMPKPVEKPDPMLFEKPTAKP